MIPAFIMTAFLITLFLSLSISMLAYPLTANSQKKLSFECGFNSMSKSKSSFSAKFFLVMILFLVFDLEVAILLPACTNQSSLLMSTSMSIAFVLLLTIVMILEWVNGIIEWSS